jgi:hypothetical protein
MLSSKIYVRSTTVIILRLNLAMGTLINMSQVKVKVD